MKIRVRGSGWCFLTATTLTIVAFFCWRLLVDGQRAILCVAAGVMLGATLLRMLIEDVQDEREEKQGDRGTL